MTWSDAIVDEVRRAREAYATRFNYDLQAIYRDLKDQEKRSGRKVVPPPISENAVDSGLGEAARDEHLPAMASPVK